MAVTLSKIPKLHPDKVADPSWEVVGVAPNGTALYKEVSPRARAVPDIDENGERRYRKHGVTGERLYGLNKPEMYTLERTFYLESDGQGNNYKIDYTPPTPEQIEAEKRRQAAKDMVPALAEALVAEGLTPADLIARLRAPAPTENGSQQSPMGDSVSEPAVEYPVMYAPGRWELSDGSKMQGKKEDAEKAEADLQQAMAEAARNAAMTPEI